VDVGVIDEGVAAVDIVGEVGEGFAGAGGADPECEAGDFDGFGGEVHAVEIVLEDEVWVLIAKLSCVFGILGDEVAGDVVVEFVEAFVGGDEECAGAAGGVDDFEMAKGGESVLVIGF